MPAAIRLRVPNLDAYAADLARAGIQCDELPDLLFQHFLDGSGMPQYEYADACAGMDELVSSLSYNAEWFWCPLTPADRSGPYLEGYHSKMNRSRREQLVGYTDKHGSYTKTIPAHIVSRIVFVRENFKAYPVTLFVADYKTAPDRRADPYLLAMVPGGKPHIIGQWDLAVWHDDDPDHMRQGRRPRRAPKPKRFTVLGLTPIELGLIVFAVYAAIKFGFLAAGFPPYLAALLSGRA
jgi:hypothetical protein